MCIHSLQFQYRHVASILPPLTTHYIYSRDVISFKNRSYYKTNADDEADAKNNLVLTPEYEKEADPKEKQFYDKLQQQTEDNAWKRIPENNAKKRVTVNDAEERVPKNDKRTLANEAEERIPTNLPSNLGPRWAIPKALRTFGSC